MKRILFTIALFLTLFPQTVFAQEYRTDSQTVTTTVGTVTKTSSSLAAAAIDLVTVIKAACNGIVRGSNISCLQGLTFTHVANPNLAITTIKQSATDNRCDSAPTTCLQCVGFVQGAVGGTTGKVLNKGGNAKDFATNVPTGYTYTSLSGGATIQEGDIIIKTGGQYGHIAIVTKVYSQTTIQIAEGNYNTNGEVGLNNSAVSLWNGFLRAQ